MKRISRPIHIEFRFFIYYVHWIDACDFMILSLKLSVFFVLLSNFCWLLLPHVLFINSCMYYGGGSCLFSFSTSFYRYCKNIFPFELLMTIDWCVCIYIYVCACIDLELYGRWTRFLFFSLVLIVNWQLLVYQAKCVGKQSNINSESIFGMRDTHTHYLFIHA